MNPLSAIKFTQLCTSGEYVCYLCNLGLILLLLQDLIFVIRQIPHDHYRREGDDLFIAVGINLSTALCEGKIDITALDGRTLRVPLKEVVHPGYQRLVAKEGMPNSKTGVKGNLKIDFRIVFPKQQLSGDKASQIKALLD